jgi:hypothetical protein
MVLLRCENDFLEIGHIGYKNKNPDLLDNRMLPYKALIEICF